MSEDFRTVTVWKAELKKTIRQVDTDSIYTYNISSMEDHFIFQKH